MRKYTIWFWVGVLVKKYTIWIRVGVLVKKYTIWIRVGVLVRKYTIWFRVGVLVMLLQFNSIFEFVVVYMVPFSLQTCALYWPEEYGYTVEYGPLSIELLFSSEADTNITVRTFKLTHRLKVWTSTQLY